MSQKDLTCDSIIGAKKQHKDGVNKMGLFSKKKSSPFSGDKHEYIINATHQFARSITTQEWDIELSWDETRYLLGLLNQVKGQGKTELKLDSPQMYIEVSVDMYLQDLAIGMSEAMNTQKDSVRFNQSYEQLFVLFMFFDDVYQNNDFVREDSTATSLREKLGHALALFNLAIGLV